LNVSSNFISNKGADQLANYLCGFKEIEYIIISKNLINDSGISKILIASFELKLKYLDISQNSIGSMLS